MSDETFERGDHVALSLDHLQVVENVLTDTPTPRHTRAIPTRIVAVVTDRSRRRENDNAGVAAAGQPPSRKPEGGASR